MDRKYFNKDYFENGRGSSKSGYVESSFALCNDVFKHQADMLFDILKLKNKTVVDIGCAKNNLVYWMRKRGIDAWGQDVSEWCQQDSHVKDYHKCADAGESILFNDNSLDAIVSFEVFEHIENIDGLITNMVRALKPGGYLFATIGSDGHEMDKSAVSLHQRDWWESRFDKHFIEESGLAREFNNSYLVGEYHWKVYCYKN